MLRTQIKTLPLRRSESPVARILAFLVASLNRRRERALLGRLDNHMLRDIGLDPKDAAQEAAKPFWQP